MDPRERADAALARARARGAYVVTPDDAVSPMDASNTVQIPRSVVSAADSNHDEPDNTMVISAGVARGQQPPYPGYQQTNRQQQPGHHQQPVPYPGNQQQPQYQHPQYQTGPHQPVPPPAHRGYNEQHGYTEQGYQEQSPYEEQPEPRQLDGLVPTTQEPAIQRSTLSRRLDGQ